MLPRKDSFYVTASTAIRTPIAFFDHRVAVIFMEICRTLTFEIVAKCRHIEGFVVRERVLICIVF